jgi:primosomal protein N'
MKEGKGLKKSFLVEVTPLTKGSGTDQLSYFSSVKLAPGTLVKIPLRKGFVHGLVLRARDVRTAKTEIRRAGFLLKKINKSDILPITLPLPTLEALKKTTHYYATSIGTLLASHLPKVFIDEPENYLKPINERKKRNFEHAPETILLQMESEERFGQYRALVRQAFARGNSAMVIVPTHMEIERVKNELAKGINDFVYTFSLSGKKKEMRENWRKALSEPHPILLISTSAGILFPRKDVDTVIIERENSRAYRTLTRPYIHIKVLLENLTKASQQQLVLGDSVLSLEMLAREKSGEFGESSLIRWRLPASPTSLIDSQSKQNENGRFEIFSPELKELMDKALNEQGRIFLFGARKGLAPTTVCGDCGFVLPCLNCGAPVVLHKHGEKTIYICHACRERRDSTTTCGYCGSWKLVPLGIGTVEIARQAHALFPKHKVLVLDKDHAPTDREAQKIIKCFQEEGGILVGTELAFFHLTETPFSALVSVDALFSVPDFSINERIFYLVSRMRELTKGETLIQTRNIGKQILAWSSQGNIIDFYQNEVEERKALLYPPFSIFVKITAIQEKSQQTLLRLKEELRQFNSYIFNDSLIFRVPKNEWPQEEIVKKISLLGPEFSIKVDPDSIL